MVYLNLYICFTQTVSLTFKMGVQGSGCASLTSLGEIQGTCSDNKFGTRLYGCLLNQSNLSLFNHLFEMLGSVQTTNSMFKNHLTNVYADLWILTLNVHFLYCRDKTHVDWTRAWIAALTELQAYIKQYHTTGVEWNKQVIQPASKFITSSLTLTISV